LQRVYGIAFPTNKELTNYITAMEESKKYDHRILGEQQELFYFDPMSPGSAFFLPHGTIIYNKLQNFIRKEYRNLGYTEVMSPNIYNMELWEKSGHAKHYKENMFCFKIDEQEFGLKPMNCPGHCLLFKSKLHSYRDLPIRYADFGVLHRNEASGALTGLTRVRRFQQDDAHIFCRDDQIKQEILTALNFVKKVYGIFGMQFKLELSTKPAKSMGDLNIWNMAEKQMEDSLNEFAGSGNWKINPGDGAFYGPKIDIKVMDTMHRIHQTATIQLDFQLPINFDLKYKSDKDVMSRPVIIHRAVLGSTERCFAILIEHFKGKWPFFLSPRQAIVIPIASEYDEYAKSVQQKLWENEFDIEVDLDNNTLKKKIRSGEVKQFNYILVVGEKERGNNTVNIRTRDNVILGEKTIDEVISLFKTEIAENR
jgi:threonyl-tRNA synthetase